MREGKRESECEIDRVRARYWEWEVEREKERVVAYNEAAIFHSKREKTNLLTSEIKKWQRIKSKMKLDNYLTINN